MIFQNVDLQLGKYETTIFPIVIRSKGNKTHIFRDVWWEKLLPKIIKVLH
jgi:hypothetical protein